MPIEHVGRANGRLFYVMPLADGEGSTDPASADWRPVDPGDGDADEVLTYEKDAAAVFSKRGRGMPAHEFLRRHQSLLVDRISGWLDYSTKSSVRAHLGCLLGTAAGNDLRKVDHEAADQFRVQGIEQPFGKAQQFPVAFRNAITGKPHALYPQNRTKRTARTQWTCLIWYGPGFQKFLRSKPLRGVGRDFAVEAKPSANGRTATTSTDAPTPPTPPTIQDPRCPRE